jgi:hypothetical protein
VEIDLRLNYLVTLWLEKQGNELLKIYSFAIFSPLIDAFTFETLSP